jgi:hypothetical protein
MLEEVTPLRQSILAVWRLSLLVSQDAFGFGRIH